MTGRLEGGATYSGHFLTLPGGHTVSVPEGKDADEVFFAHASASIAEGICPWCLSSLDDRRQCFDSCHRIARWHLCAEGIGYVHLDVPQPVRDATCKICGEAM